MPKRVNEKHRIKEHIIGLKDYQKEFLKKESHRTGVSISQLVRSLIDKKIKKKTRISS